MGSRFVRARRLMLAIVAGSLGALAWMAPASAHNSLASSDPKDGARLAVAPASVRLTFLARLDPETMKVDVMAPDGSSVTAGAATFDGATVRVPVRPTAAGRYTVAYSVASDDGHPVTGSIHFTLTAAAVPSASPPASPTPSPTPGATTAGRLSPAPAANTDDGGTPWWPWAAGGAALLAAVGGGAALSRRRARS